MVQNSSKTESEMDEAKKQLINALRLLGEEEIRSMLDNECHGWGHAQSLAQSAKEKFSKDGKYNQEIIDLSEGLISLVNRFNTEKK